MSKWIMREHVTSPHLKIRIESLSKSFVIDDKQKLVLDGINLTVAEREFVSVVGPSGCGKSTLLNVIAGLEEPCIERTHSSNINVIVRA